MSTFTETLADRVLELERRTRQLTSANAKLRTSRDNWKHKATQAELQVRHMTYRHRMLLIDKANLIAKQTVR